MSHTDTVSLCSNVILTRTLRSFQFIKGRFFPHEIATGKVNWEEIYWKINFPLAIPWYVLRWGWYTIDITIYVQIQPIVSEVTTHWVHVTKCMNILCSELWPDRRTAQCKCCHSSRPNKPLVVLQRNAPLHVPGTNYKISETYSFTYNLLQRSEIMVMVLY